MIAVACVLGSIIGAVGVPAMAGAGPDAGAGRMGSELPVSPADPNHPITDQALLASIAAATSGTGSGNAARGERIPPVGVEVLTGATDAVAATVRSLGGAVTGTVPGYLVQASMPVAGVDALALARGVTYVESPHLVAPPPRPEEAPRPETSRPEMPRPEAGPGTGTTVGQNVALTNAAAWQAAGITGAVKVGVIDYFDRGLWKTSEEGPLPDAAHTFCLDSSTPLTSTDNLCNPSNNDGVDNGDGFEHGVAVVQVLKDMAPAAEVYVATAGTTTDLQAAIEFFVANGVRIVTRSLGAAYDGAGDGTGPLAAVVDSAAARGITWFNSGGNDAADGYVRVTVPNDLSSTGGYVDFDSGPGVDTYLRLSGPCILFDGIRWSDWNLPVASRTDYAVEAWEPVVDPGSDESVNPTQLISLGTADDDQSKGAPPLEAADERVCPHNKFGADGGIVYIRIKRKEGTPVVGDPDVLEVALGEGYTEHLRSQAASSSAKPVVDSRNPELLAVGAVDPADGSGFPDAIAFYSSQGPTNDGRIKPDISAPSCVKSTIYQPCFNGTSAASPTAAGMAALLLSAGVVQAGLPLAAAMRHFVFDRPFTTGGAPDGPDNKYGAGQVRLPSVPTVAPAVASSAYHPVSPTRILDTRTASPVGSPIGALPQQGIVDVAIAGIALAGGATVPATAAAVAINLTVTDTVADGFVQAIPFLRTTYGTSSTLNVPAAGTTRANFAIVPIGVDGKISVYDVPGGNVIVDVLGYFDPAAGPVTGGRFVAIDPVRALDTRTAALVPTGWVAHVPSNESVVVPVTAAVVGGASALVLNVTSTQAQSPGFLRAQPTGSVPSSSTVNYVAGVDASNSVIVPVGPDGTVSIYTSAASHIVVDITGYITGTGAAASTTGLFVPVATARAYDSRQPGPANPVPSAFARTLQLTGLAAPLPSVPAGATGVAVNLTAVDEIAPGYLSVYPSGGTLPATSNLNYATGTAVANGVLTKLSSGGAVDIYANTQSDIVVDVNGYFTG
ncbi:MAG: hypothetical protein JWM34_815 [Ilumatobacteraceae bacterium]|nr:hypothetical protein [Ilumatobacteraceae bacterium]